MTPFDLIQDIADERPSNLGEFLYVELEVNGVRELHTEFVEVL